MSAFDLIALKQPLGRDDADRMSMPALLYLDAAKRGQGTASIENGLIRVVVIAQSIGSIKRNKKFYDLACAGGRAHCFACSRNRLADSPRAADALRPHHRPGRQRLHGTLLAVQRLPA